MFTDLYPPPETATITFSCWDSLQINNGQDQINIVYIRRYRLMSVCSADWLTSVLSSLPFRGRISLLVHDHILVPIHDQSVLDHIPFLDHDECINVMV